MVQLLPYLILVIMVAKGIGDRLCDGHFILLIYLNGLPYINSQTGHKRNDLSVRGNTTRALRKPRHSILPFICCLGIYCLRHTRAYSGRPTGACQIGVYEPLLH